MTHAEVDFTQCLEDEFGSSTATSCHSIDLQHYSAESSATHCGEQDEVAARTDLHDCRVNATAAADQSLLLASVIDALEADSNLMVRGLPQFDVYIPGSEKPMGPRGVEAGNLILSDLLGCAAG